MLSIKKFIVPLMFTAAVFAGCTKEAAIPFEPHVEQQTANNPTDLTIQDILNSYQTKIIYKWDRRYISADASATPPQFELIKPYIDNVLRKLFIAAYDRQKSDFMIRHMPIEMIFIGSAINYDAGDERNFSASGMAQSFSRILITGINSYDLNNKSWLRGQYATLHHEFAHVLDKIYGRPTGFDDVSKGKYAGSTSFAVFTQAEARSRGFWKNYGMTSEGEDFATWIDGIVTTPKAEVLTIAESNDLLNRKYKMVYNFYLEKGIDLHVLNEYLQTILN
jgi:substrate import-associated zinc metallohydrolase lipoprotein